MYNFLDHKLLPKVTSSVAAVDGYDVDNLISNSAIVRSRGFLAFASIKPPVDVTFQLICPVYVSVIKIKTINGKQKCNGIEVLFKRSDEHVSLGKVFYSEEGVIFFNSKFGKPQNEAHCTVALKSLVSPVSNIITIRILRTEKSVPCLGSVEICGFVSHTCTRTTRNTIQNLMFPKPNILTSTVPNIPIEDKIFQFPDDFKDAITEEIMSLPMTLPSGNTVDKSTLEKCIANDILYGRKSADPFTGVAFDVLKPKLNVALKSRIDMFLLQNAHQPETFPIHRTCGKKRKCETVSSVKRILVEKMDSLDATIENIINGDNFVCFTRESNDMIETVCASCKINQNLYSLKCEHIYCKTCLTNLVCSSRCVVCKVIIQKSDVTKLNK